MSADAGPTRPTLLLSVHSTALGGAERCALDEAKRLSRSYQLVVAAPDGPLRAEFADRGMLVKGPPLLPIWGDTPRRWAVQLVRTALDTGRLVSLIRRERIAGVVCNSSVALSPVLAGWLTRRPVVVHLRDSPNSRFARPLLRMEARLATTIIPVSEGLAALCGPAPRARIVRVADGIRIPPLPRSRAPFRDPLRLGVVGAIDQGKGQDLALRALSALADVGVRAELHFVGREQDSAYAAELRSTARAHGIDALVHFHGEHRDLEPIYADLDVLLLPSRREAFGLVVLEALARCLPVVASRVGSVPQLLLDGEAGVVVEPEDPAALGAGVLMLRDNPELVRSLTLRGRHHVLENYDLEKTIELACAEIARVIWNGPRPRPSLAADSSMIPSHSPSDPRGAGELSSGP
jgi:glycosyltransferase involved in cell wall biosynthesis